MFNVIKFQNFIENPIVFFSDKELNEYIGKYLTLCIPNNYLIWDNIEAYEQAINKIPGLRQLIVNSFLLAVTIEGMPSILSWSIKAENKFITKAVLFDQFIQQLLEYEENQLLIEDKLPTDGSDVKEDFWEFAMELAVAMHEFGVDSILEGDYTWNQFFYPKVSSGHKEQQLIRAKNACKLILRDLGQNRYSFIHKDFQDYFVIKKILLEEEIRVSKNKLNF